MAGWYSQGHQEFGPGWCRAAIEGPEWTGEKHSTLKIWASVARPNWTIDETRSKRLRRRAQHKFGRASIELDADTRSFPTDAEMSVSWPTGERLASLPLSRCFGRWLRVRWRSTFMIRPPGGGGIVGSATIMQRAGSACSSHDAEAAGTAGPTRSGDRSMSDPDTERLRPELREALQRLAT
jgi:hypothetical protein